VPDEYHPTRLHGPETRPFFKKGLGLQKPLPEEGFFPKRCETEVSHMCNRCCTRIWIPKISGHTVQSAHIKNNNGFLLNRFLMKAIAGMTAYLHFFKPSSSESPRKSGFGCQKPLAEQCYWPIKNSFLIDGLSQYSKAVPPELAQWNKSVRRQ
jgi:hypothetical protein